MKKWECPSVESLDLTCTEQGKNVSTQFDEVRVDQNGNYWVSFISGTDSKPDVNGEVIVK